MFYKFIKSRIRNINVSISRIIYLCVKGFWTEQILANGISIAQWKVLLQFGHSIKSENKVSRVMLFTKSMLKCITFTLNGRYVTLKLPQSWY